MNHNYSQTTDMRSETPKTEPPVAQAESPLRATRPPYAVNKILGRVGGMRSEAVGQDAQRTKLEARNPRCRRTKAINQSAGTTTSPQPPLPKS